MLYITLTFPQKFGKILIDVTVLGDYTTITANKEFLEVKVMMQQVMFIEAKAHSCYADAHGMLDEGIYIVQAELKSAKKYYLHGKYGFFDCDWFVPVHYSTEMPAEEKRFLITDYKGEKSIITPYAAAKTTYNNVYKVYAKEREDFYVVSVKC